MRTNLSTYLLACIVQRSAALAVFHGDLHAAVQELQRLLNFFVLLSFIG